MEPQIYRIRGGKPIYIYKIYIFFLTFGYVMHLKIVVRFKEGSKSYNFEDPIKCINKSSM